MYRIIRTTGQKCWFLRAEVGSTRRVEQSPPVAELAARSRPVQPTVPSCVAAPDSTAPRNTEWRYRFDDITGQKCWRLSHVVLKKMPVARARTNPPRGPNHIEKDGLGSLRSVAGAQASLVASNSIRPRRVANTGHDEVRENVSDQPPMTTFESRWVMPTEIGSSTHATTGQPKASVLIPDGGGKPLPNAAKFQTGRSRAADSEMMSRLLAATAASIGIALGLYGLISGSVRWVRDRDSISRPAGSARVDPSSPPVDTTISDILERLNSEDARALSEAGDPRAWEAEPDRLEVGHSSGSDRHTATTRRQRAVGRD